MYVLCMYILKKNPFGLWHSDELEWLNFQETVCPSMLLTSTYNVVLTYFNEFKNETKQIKQPIATMCILTRFYTIKS